LDVLVVYDTLNTPFYLSQDYSDGEQTQRKIVRSNYIYTRIGDTNTPIDKSADIHNVEYLWKKRFGLSLSPFERVCELMKDKTQWHSDEGIHYHKAFPEFTIELIDDEETDRNNKEYYVFTMMNTKIHYGMANIKYYGTQLHNCQTVWLDSGRYLTATPEWGTIEFDKDHRNGILYKFFITDTPQWYLHQYLFDRESSEAESARKRFMEVVLVFKSEEEHEDFIDYVHYCHSDFVKRVYKEKESAERRIRDEAEPAKSSLALELATSTILNTMFDEYIDSKQQEESNNG
jgi:hypothetical protein